MRRWLVALVALVTLTALAFAGGAYRYCHMAGRAMTSCCCASATNDALSDDAPKNELVREPCCERRTGAAAEAASSANLDSAAQSLGGPPAVSPWAAILPERPVGGLDVALLSRHARSPVTARGPPPGQPPRRGKARARLGVMRC